VPIVGTSAGELVAQTQGELADVAEAIRSHRFLELLRSRDVPRERLAALAGAQHMIVSSDRRSFAVLAARFPDGLASEFFLSLADGEGVALRRLQGLSEWLGMTDAEVAGYEPDPGTQAYPAFVAWLALNGSRADVVLAFLANLAVWGGTALRSPPRCAMPTAPMTGRWRSSTSSPIRRRTLSHARWQC
jgi:thiaminase